MEFNAAPPSNLLQAMFSHTRMAMIATDPSQPDNPIVYANEAFTKLTGYSHDEVIGRNCRFLQGPDSDQAEIEKIREAIRKEEFCYVELLNYRKDGTPFWNALHVSPVYDQTGKLTHFFGSQWDVTEQRTSLAAIKGEARSSDEKMQKAIDQVRAMEIAINQAKDSILITEYGPLDEPGPRITWVSKGFERMTGYAADEVIGRSPRFLQGPETDREALNQVRASLEAGKGHDHTRVTNYRKDGTPFQIEWSISPIMDSDGNPQAWLSVQRDVSEQVRAEEEQERLLNELDHRVRNLFSTVQVITRSADDIDGTAESLRRRLLYQLQALNAAHGVVFSDPSHPAPLADIVTAVLEPFDPSAKLIERAGSETYIGPKQATNAALALYELALLSSEHGALSKRKPVKLAWQKQGSELRITWTEEAKLPEENRFGFGLVKTFVKASKWSEAGITEEDGVLTIRLGLRAG
ncbi:PAS domain-containing protein [Parvularcula lutaonensis]|uniref:histidine kinase n=1 Tax=Parvularcula lutaonensis TaxID=491923 RepID=A0ABV7M9U7_9PROT|nr:PAS domain-containing protein [Parvularcula lutaonensis]GGY47534.1 hypothetical protein GCM10007148_16160 [Parvularcula lutaonensis]